MSTNPPQPGAPDLPIPLDDPSAQIVLDGSRVEVRRLTIDDPVVADLLASHPPERRSAELIRVLQVGARGITAMGSGLTISDVADQVGRALAATTETAQQRVDAVLDAGRQALAETLDPDVRASIAGRMVGRLTTLHGELLRDLDPARSESHTGRFLDELARYFGADGELDTRLADALDPAATGSPMARLREGLESEIRQLRDVVMRESGRAEESSRGTRKGFEYEDTIEELLRTAAKGLGGVVERTSQTAGSLGSGAIVGDLVLSLPDGGRIVIEAKHVTRLGLTGSGGTLEELDRAMANRSADFAICVSAMDAFPAEVGAFGVYGNRILVVDDGDGVMLGVALRWAQTTMVPTLDGAAPLDTGLLADRLDRIREVAGRVSTSKRALASIRTGIDTVRNDLDTMRLSLFELVDEAKLELRRSAPAASKRSVA